MKNTSVYVLVWLSVAFAELAAGCSAPLSTEAHASIAEATQTPFTPVSSETSFESAPSTSEPTLPYSTPTPFAVEEFADFEMNIAKG